MRIYQPIPLKTDTAITLDEAASHHVARVLRATLSDEIIIFNGEGGEFEATITEITKKNVIVYIKKFLARDVESPLELWLAQGISRGEKMDFTIQKAVELGVTKIIPLLTERCNVQLNAEKKQKRWEHWQAIIIHACEQSGRTTLPKLSLPEEFSSWIKKAPKASANFVLTPDAKNAFKINDIPKTAQILIGPEGGLSAKEIEEACQLGFTPTKLGPRILRTETAGVAALSVLQCLYGDLVGPPTSNSKN